tara:strand:- start:328 stop:462 length:135 start_codon:yes stop_codon:yes gene_type:complete
MKITDDYAIKQELVRLLKLVNGTIGIGYIALAVYGLVKIIEVFV